MDYKELLKKYIKYISSRDGASFSDYELEDEIEWFQAAGFTDADKEELSKLKEEVNAR